MAALLLAVAFLSPVDPVLLVGIPLAVLLLAFHPRRPLAVLLVVLILWLAFGAGEGELPLWYGERAWALISGGAFVLVTLRWSGARLVLRSIVAVSAAFLVFGAFGLVRPNSLAMLDWSMAAELRWTSRTVANWLAGAEADSFLRSLATTVGDMVEVQVALYPALLALATVAALGVAWFVTIRLTGAEGAVGPLREFGFSDHLIWVLIGGLLLFLLPIGHVAARVGQNTLAFMGGLYVLRGAAILAWLAPAFAVSAWSTLLWAIVALLFYPIVLGLALVLGVSDTWLDLRARLRGSDGSQGST